jgi:hypothetical protein
MRFLYFYLMTGARDRSELRHRSTPAIGDSSGCVTTWEAPSRTGQVD